MTTSTTEQRLTEALHDIVAAQPFRPDPTAIERRGRVLHRRAMVTRGAVAVGAVAVVTVGAVGMSRPATVDQVAVAPSKSTSVGPLVRLADYLQANTPQPTGDATLVLRTTTYPGSAPITVADLYGDNGKYFFAHTRSGLPAQVAADHDQGNGIAARELAAALYATHGDLAVARQRMADAPGPDPSPGPVPPPTGPEPASVTDNHIWENSIDAVIPGAGNPQVLAGVLRIVSTLPEVTVRNTTTDGRPTLALTAGPGAFAPDLPATTSDHEETLTINARTGVPITVTAGAPGTAPDTTVSYRISRVTLSDVAAGKF
jgi:hypothetical protein